MTKIAQIHINGKYNGTIFYDSLQISGEEITLKCGEQLNTIRQRDGLTLVCPDIPSPFDPSAEKAEVIASAHTKIVAEEKRLDKSPGTNEIKHAGTNFARWLKNKECSTFRGTFLEEYINGL